MKWKAVAVLLGVFLLGTGSGILLDRVALRPDEPRTPRQHRHGRLLHRLTTELDLSPQQQEQVDTILATMRTELDTLRQHILQQVEEVLTASEHRIETLLGPEQRQAFHKLIAEHHAHRKQPRQRHLRRWRKQP